jgi:hypothetical protein
MVSAVGDSDLSPVGDPVGPANRPSEERGAGTGSALSGRGLVVFPAPDRPRRQRLVVRYAPFLVTVALGAVVVLVVALVR